MSTSFTNSFAVLKNFSLYKLNTLKLECSAEEYVLASSVEQLAEATQFSGPINFLGGGSNVLLLPRVRGRLIHIDIQGITVERASKGEYSVRVGAGENWHRFVLHTLNLGIRGLENLALIPGNVGGAPYQNIGAYGRELSELVHSVEVFDLTTNKSRKLSNEECQFSYRNSVFRSKVIPPAIITHVNFLLGRLPLTTSFRDVHERLSGFSKEELDHNLVAETVINIRKHKLPDLDTHPNVGSFFKNPTLSKKDYDGLRGKLEIAGFSQGDTVRVPAARLIDEQKWKGRQVGNVLVWHKQPLVLVNGGNASAEEFLDVAQRITDDVEKHYGVHLEIEPVLMGNKN